ncbi:WD40 repeat domain-containing protein [Paenibacillus agilis]|uniref:WD40 repeat domain-containing protein n=1 Tax=Paenibacillus agilis TaxID=3020863 RepID=A0A559J1H9_9BACL|nr:hypothetical protein [Paenibacillus agilis]TVX93748.1 hypothetical protein FPZ44_12170 [Paenibacillus agilis]
MTNRNLIVWSGILSLLVTLLSGCSAGPQTETIIMPSKEEINIVGQTSSPFQVKNIYRLPYEFTSSGQLLGWSSSDSVIASFKTESVSEGLQLKRLTYPFEQSQIMSKIKMDDSQIILSPDGKYLAMRSSSVSGDSLKLLSLEDGKETEIAKFSNRIFVQDISWSNNSRYLGYLTIDPSGGEKDSLRLYDMESRTSKIVELKDMTEGNSPISIHVSDDGRSVLFTMLPDQSGKRTLLLGEISHNKMEKQFTRPSAGEQSAWISSDQFVFLGYDGTLYEYDRRNGALSVILERVSSFKLSHDKKKIAYSLYDENIIYVGTLQGRNVLSNGPVYHGIVPTNMYWSLDNKKLLIQGQSNSTEEQSFILEFE